MKRKLLFFLIPFLLLFFHSQIEACDCSAFPPLSKSIFRPENKKMIVFRGKVLNVGKCNKLSECNFEVEELFFGNTTKNITAFFDCESSCMMNFNPGEDWIIYGEYVQVEKIKIEFCSRSRKISGTVNEEIDNLAYGMSIADELIWLREKIGKKIIKPNNEQRLAGHRNEKPDPSTKIILILISIVAMVLFLIFSKKFFK